MYASEKQRRVLLRSCANNSKAFGPTPREHTVVTFIFLKTHATEDLCVSDFSHLQLPEVISVGSQVYCLHLDKSVWAYEI